MTYKQRFRFTRYLAAALLLLGILCAVCGSWLTQRAIQTATRLEVLEAEIQNLRQLSLEYRLEKSDRSKTQWLAQHSSITRHLAELATIPDEITTSAGEIKLIFDKIIELNAADSNDLMRSRLVKHQYDALEVESQRLLDWGTSLQEASRKSFFQKVTGYGIFTTALIITIATISAVLINSVGDRILSSIATLKNGTDLYATGELAHHITISGDDEISALAQSFNRMRDELDAINSGLEQVIIEEIEKSRAKDAIVLQQDKLASIGQLAAGVAHEINNPAGFVTSNLKTFREYVASLTQHIHGMKEIVTIDSREERLRKLDESAERHDIPFILDDMPSLIDESLEGTERVRHIVKDLKDFARPDEQGIREADLNACVTSTANIVRNSIKNIAELTLDLGDIPPLLCHPQQINQVITNLLINAAHSMNNFGTITVNTRKDGDYLLLSVKDNGCGIPEEILHKIYEPFFSTKDVGRGTGLGLSITYDIVTKHGGSITVDSSVGTGSEFIIRLPISGPPEPSGQTGYSARYTGGKAA